MSSWLSFILLVGLCLFSDGVSGARHRKEHHSAAVLTGTVQCDTCFRQQEPKSTNFISGATVEVECGSDDQKQRFRQEVITNEKGEFEVKLPHYIAKNADKIKACSVKLITSNHPYCAVAATATSSEIHFNQKKPHIFSAGFFTFKPQLCDQKDLIGKDFPPVGGGMLPPLPVVPDVPIPPIIPPVPNLPGAPLPPVPNLPGVPLPPVPNLPEVPLPPVPNLPGVPLPPPITHQNPPESNIFSDQKVFGFPFPPNPFQPPQILPPLPFVPSPPSIIPPLPFTPSPPSLLPPIFPSPPPASMFPPLPFPPVPGLIPPVPGLIPSPPPPPPPAFPIPLPPLPNIPGLPPVPPASNHLGKTTP